MTAEEIAAINAEQPPVNNDHVAPGATEIAANAAVVAPPQPAPQIVEMTTATGETLNAEEIATAVAAAEPQGELALEDMQIAMLSAAEVTFKNGRSLPIVGFTDANGERVTNLANATCAHAGDGGISIPLVGVPVQN